MVQKIRYHSTAEKPGVMIVDSLTDWDPVKDVSYIAAPLASVELDVLLATRNDIDILVQKLQRLKTLLDD